MATNVTKDAKQLMNAAIHLGLSRPVLADCLGVSTLTVNRWMRGRTAIPPSVKRIVAGWVKSRVELNRVLRGRAEASWYDLVHPTKDGNLVVDPEPPRQSHVKKTGRSRYYADPSERMEIDMGPTPTRDDNYGTAANVQE